MGISDNTKPIVVAVDGSDSALRATRWAAAEALRRGRRLRIVHSYVWPLPAYGPAHVDATALHHAIQANAAAILRDAAASVAEVAPDLHPEAEALRGAVIPMLHEVSGHAALLVLGSRGLGGFTGLLLGSVAVALAAHGRCPVVVVRGAELDWPALAEVATETLAERLAGWQEKYPEVTVRRVVEHHRPALALLTAAKDAQLLVVGSRGRGGFAGLTLGSVSQAMIRHAPAR